jgi:ribosomal protein S18 acetylase RimI-like enzyme
MDIIGLTSLADKQTEQILELQQHCISYDGSGRELFLSNDINYHKEMSCFFLCYIEEVLCGVLTVFAPTMETAEISAFVDPSHRRLGIFSKLLLEAWRMIHQYKISKVLIVTDAISTVCKEILSKWQAELSHSEYLLAYQGDGQPSVFSFSDKCIVREASEADFDEMVEMNMVNFGEDRANASPMVRQRLNHNLTLCFVGLMGNEIFGLADVRKEDSDLYICGFNITPSRQGKGFGRYLLYQILDRLTPTEDETIILEVDSSNQPAYHLYTTSGFTVQSQADYYRLSLPLPKDPV